MDDTSFQSVVTVHAGYLTHPHCRTIQMYMFHIQQSDWCTVEPSNLECTVAQFSQVHHLPLKIPMT